MSEVLVKFGKHVDMPVTELVETQKLYCAWVKKKAESGMGSKVLNELNEQIILIKNNELNKLSVMMHDDAAQVAIDKLKNTEIGADGVIVSKGTETKTWNMEGDKPKLVIGGIEVGDIINPHIAVQGLKPINTLTVGRTLNEFLSKITEQNVQPFYDALGSYPLDSFIIYTVTNDPTIEILFSNTRYQIFDNKNGSMLGSH